MQTVMEGSMNKERHKQLRKTSNRGTSRGKRITAAFKVRKHLNSCGIVKRQSLRLEEIIEFQKRCLTWFGNWNIRRSELEYLPE